MGYTDTPNPKSRPTKVSHSDSRKMILCFIENTAYSSQMISEKKLSRQNIDLFKSNNYIVVVDCNYECIDIAYQYSDSNEWLVPGSFYLGNDQYSINAVPVTLNRSINAKYVTYRIEIYTDSGTETVYFSTKFQ